jgi:hypothetical protein
MIGGSTDWLRFGHGHAPEQSWSFATEGPLVAMDVARETGEIMAADATGGLYHVSAKGKLINLTHGPSPIRAISFSDVGRGGIALVGENRLYWFDRNLAFQGSIEHSEPVFGLAIEAHGNYAAASLADRSTIVYDCHRQRVRRFGSLQPFIAMEFLVARPALVGVAEYGLLCCHSFNGRQEWAEPLFGNVGDMAITGDGKSILLACYGHGIQCHNAEGVQAGSYQLGGTVCRVSTGFLEGRIAAATMERHFYLLNSDGAVIWQALLPDDICRLVCDPVGTSIICGFQSGRIVRLAWSE